MGQTLPEKQLEGGDREREGQETGLNKGRGGQLRGVGAAKGGCACQPGTGLVGCGWWQGLLGTTRPPGGQAQLGAVPTV